MSVRLPLHLYNSRRRRLQQLQMAVFGYLVFSVVGAALLGMLTREEQTLAQALGVSAGAVSLLVGGWALLLAAALVAAPIVNYQLQLGDGSLCLGAREWRIEPRGLPELRLPLVELQNIRFTGSQPFRGPVLRRRWLLPRLRPAAGLHYSIGSVSAVWKGPGGQQQTIEYHFRIDTQRQWYALRDYTRALARLTPVQAEWGSEG